MFKDRRAAGLKLASRLEVGEKGLVLGIPRGGVVLGKVIAEKLGWSLDVLVCKKIGFPGHEELAMGAMAETGKSVWDKRFSKQIGMKEKDKQEKEAREKVKRYIKEFRGGTPLRTRLRGAGTVIIVDDGIATGQTLEAGIKYLQGQALKMIVAVPVCAKRTADRLRQQVDEWVCLMEPESFYAVGQFYKNFEQVSDEEVKRLLV